MTRSSMLRRTIAGMMSAGLLVGLSAPVAAVNIPEGGAVTPGSTFVINFQVQEGCEGMPVDTLEVTIPESIGNAIPEAVPGWLIETETADDGSNSLVRWTGGSMPDGSFLEFGMRAGFPDEPGASIEFPVVKRCGLTSVDYAPTVVLQPRLGVRDLLELQQTVDALGAEVEEIGDRLGNVNVVNLRDRLAEVESSIEQLSDRLGSVNVVNLRDRVAELEEAQEAAAQEE